MAEGGRGSRKSLIVAYALRKKYQYQRQVYRETHTPSSEFSKAMFSRQRRECEHQAIRTSTGGSRGDDSKAGIFFLLRLLFLMMGKISAGKIAPGGVVTLLAAREG